MKFYYVNADLDGHPYTGTLDEAKRLAREVAETSYHDITVDHVEVGTDRANVLRLLNTSGGTHVHLRTVYTAKAKAKIDD